MNAAIEMANEIMSNSKSVNIRARWFDGPCRFSKAELVAVASSLGIDSSGTRSTVLFRIARHGADN
jgi:hypothetical protein